MSNRVALDNSRQRKRPCANGCGLMTLKYDLCFNCRDELRPRRGGRTPTGKPGTPRKCKACIACEGLSWRRPEKGKCKCGKRYAPEPRPKHSVGLTRSMSIFTCASTRV